MREKRRSPIKIIAIVLAVCIALFGGGFGVYKATRGASKPVNVYPLDQIANENSWYDQNETEGMVRADNMQSVYISSSQKLIEVFVEEGQTVKAGDQLASFDTTLSDVELERQRIHVEKAKLELDDLNKELAKINRYKPYVQPAPKPEPTPIPDEPTELDSWDVPTLLGGSGTPDDPYRYLWDDDCWYTEGFINGLLPKYTPEPTVPEETEEPTDEPTDESTEPTDDPTDDPTDEPADEPTDEPTDEPIDEPIDEPVNEPVSVWVAFEIREYNNPEGALIQSWGIQFMRNSDGQVQFIRFTPAVDYSDGAGDDYFDSGDDYTGPSEEDGTYTAAEINRMKAETRQRIKDKEIEIKVENVKYEKMKLELDTGIVTADIDGVVKTLNDPETVKTTGDPFIVVSAGGGYYVTGSIGELARDSLGVGDTVTVYSWMDGGMYDGTVTEIGDYPASDNNYWGGGNPNVSYYPMTVAIGDDASLREGDYVSIQYSTGGGGSAGVYLEAPFVLYENSKSYVYIENADGKLEKREVRTGRIMWGSSVQILSGLEDVEYIAFPYGKDVKNGAQAVEAELSALYESMY